MHSVLFVCRANLARSPMAVALFRSLVACAGQESLWHIESAGTWAEEGELPAPLASEALKDWGLELVGHRSRCVYRELLQGFRLILVMEKGQKEALRAEFPNLASRVYLLSEMTGIRKDIPDPAGAPLNAYVDIAQQIRHLLVTGFERIEHLARENCGSAPH
jgi:protein-tyrosine phosphatase